MSTDESGPVRKSKATLIGPDSVLVLSPMLLLALIAALLSIVVPAVSLYLDLDQRVKANDQTTQAITQRLETEVATKRDLSEAAMVLRYEIRAVKTEAGRMQMQCDPKKGGGLSCSVKAQE